MEFDANIIAAEQLARSSRALNDLARRGDSDLYALLATHVECTCYPPVERADLALRARDQYVYLSSGKESAPNPFDQEYDPDRFPRSARLVELGHRVFWRWNQTLHSFACSPTNADREMKRSLLEALTGQGGGAAIIAAVLVASFGVNAAVAAAVATLMVRLIFLPAADESCKLWSEIIDSHFKLVDHGETK